MNKKILLFCTALSLVLTGCVSAPQGLEAKQFEMLNLKNVQAQDYDCRCLKVRLGGKVVSAQALKDKTKIEVLNQTVAYFSAKPIVDSYSNGRFIAYLNGFVDPENLKDQYVTVGGVLSGKEQGKIDQADYNYPVVQADQYRIWKLVKEYYYDPDDIYDYAPFYPYGWGFSSRFFWAEPRVRSNLY
ncbi:membrane protein [Aggregatibacter actinomycetemcomitans serotype d str. SA3733]|nr:membrane protein [Aggregatibacter actinomycetemcomitans serotype d str. SA3733]